MKKQSGELATHGATRFWQRGILPKYRKAIGDGADSIIAAIREDLGGDPSAAQDVLLGQLRKCLIFQALIDKWLMTQKQFVDESGELPGCLSGFYLSVMNTSIRICERLGLERKAQGESLEAYLREKSRQAAPGSTISPAASPRQGQGGKPACARIEGEEKDK